MTIFHGVILAIVALVFFWIGVTLEALTPTRKRNYREVIDAAREVATCPNVNTLGALKTAVQFYDNAL